MNYIDTMLDNAQHNPTRIVQLRKLASGMYFSTSKMNGGELLAEAYHVGKVFNYDLFMVRTLIGGVRRPWHTVRRTHGI